MNINIRKEVIEKIKDDNEKEIKDTIEEAVSDKDELTLPGLGVILELFWKNLNEEEKNKICKIIKKNTQ